MRKEVILPIAIIGLIIVLIIGAFFLWPIYEKAKLNRDSNDDINKQYDYYMHHNYIDRNILNIYFSFFKGNKKLLTSIKSFDDLSSNNIPLNYLAFDVKTYINLSDGDEFTRRDRVIKIIESSSAIEKRINNEIKSTPLSFTIAFPFSATLLDYNFVNDIFPVVDFSMNNSVNDLPDILNGFCKSEIINVIDNGGRFYEGNDLLLDNAISSAGLYIGNDDGTTNYGMLDISDDGPLHFPSTKCDANIKNELDYIFSQSCANNQTCIDKVKYIRSLETKESVIQVGSALPTVYLNLKNLFIETDRINHNGIVVKEEATARKIAKSDHVLMGKIIMQLTPSIDCRLVTTKKETSLFDDMNNLNNSEHLSLVCTPRYQRTEINF